MEQLDEAKVLLGLREIIDPELGRDLISLGLVQIVALEGNRIELSLELATPAYSHRQVLEDEIRRRLVSLGFDEIHLHTDCRVRAVPVLGKNPVPGVKNLIAVASGKGGVGKSTLCLNLALALRAEGARVGILDCDIYGPSLPVMVGFHERARTGPKEAIFPHSVFGLQMMSMGFVIERADAVTLRGPMLHKILYKLLFQVLWEDLDYLFLDLPPGTGDVQLAMTMFMPVSGALLVTTPQEVALRDVGRGLAMFRQANIPLLGLIENMSYYLCGNCSAKHFLFGEGGGRAFALRHKLAFLGEVPLDDEVPSPLGLGEPLLIREPNAPTAQAIRELARRLASALRHRALLPAQPGLGALEV